MTLHEAQALHVKLVGQIIAFVYSQGFELTWGETYRTPAQAALNAQNGSGITNSLHCERLAVDFQLFKDGAYLTDPAAYAFMGAYWKESNPLARWGGDFHTVDADHFSLEWGGVQ